MRTLLLLAVGTLSFACDKAADDVAQCKAIAGVLADLEVKRGSCPATTITNEPQQFVRAVCNASYAAACATATTAVDSYRTCLGNVAACSTTATAAFDDAIDACVDALQTSGASEACITAVLGD